MADRTAAMAVQHALSIDVEDWFHDSSRGPMPASAAEIARGGHRVAGNLQALLDLFARHQVRATLFVLADVARKNTGLMRAAHAAGHEIACHGLHHRRLPGVASAALTDELRQARHMVEDAAQVAVAGFRAPYFIDATQLPALDAVAAAGFRYDASFMPLRWSGRGDPRLSTLPGPVRLPCGLWEIPLPLERLPTGHVLPLAAGGFALRGLPYRFFRHYLDRHAAEQGPAVVYLHPWEIDPDSPKLPGTPLHVRCFNAIGRRHLAGRLDRLLGERRFAPIAKIFADTLAGGPQMGENFESPQR